MRNSSRARRQTSPWPPLLTFRLQALDSDIAGLNLALTHEGISLAVLGLRKSRKGHVREVGRALLALPELASLKMLIVLDDTVDITHMGDVMWRFCNNADVKRDSLIIEAAREGEASHVLLDGTTKTLALDGFARDWPNILVSLPETVDAVDALWPRLGLGDLIPSPSRRYRAGIYGTGAVAEVPQASPVAPQLA